MADGPRPMTHLAGPRAGDRLGPRHFRPPVIARRVSSQYLGRHTGRQYPHWLSGRQSILAHGPSVPVRLTGRQFPLGARAVSPQLAHGPSVPAWLTGRQSPRGSRAVWHTGHQYPSGADPPLSPPRRRLECVRVGSCGSSESARVPSRSLGVGRGQFRVGGRQAHRVRRGTHAPRIAPDPSPCLRLKAPRTD